MLVRWQRVKPHREVLWEDLVLNSVNVPFCVFAACPPLHKAYASGYYVISYLNYFMSGSAHRRGVWLVHSSSDSEYSLWYRVEDVYENVAPEFFIDSLPLPCELPSPTKFESYLNCMNPFLMFSCPEVCSCGICLNISSEKNWRHWF